MESLKETTYMSVRGFNYQPSYGSCGFEIWHYFEPHIIDEEISLGKKYFPGINTLRIWLSWESFLRDKKKFKFNFKTILRIAEDHGLRTIPVLFNAWTGFPYFGGVTIGHLDLWEKFSSFHQDHFYSYLEEIVGFHYNDDRILLWDLCNEPSVLYAYGENKEVVFNWLKNLYIFCKKLKTVAPLCIGTVPIIDEVKFNEPISDVITIHPYWARNCWVKEKKDFEEFLDESVKFANMVKKPLLVTETGWGALKDEERIELLEFELSQLERRKVGFVAHLLCHTFVADGHKPYYGPISKAGYMAFIEEDGSLRYGHEIFNKFCGEENFFIGKMNVFKEHMKEVVEKCKVVTEIDGNLYTLRVPSGDMKYKAFWIRDAVYIAKSALIKPEEIKGWIKLVASRQNGKERKLENGLAIPTGAIPDHINFDGGAVFFPGTYESGENQGDGSFGFYPPHDNQYFFIEMTYHYLKDTGDIDFLKECIKEIPLIERLSLAFESYNIDKKSQLCFSDKNRYTVDWGFCDGVMKSGVLFFPSLLRYQAALMMKEIMEKLKDTAKTSYYCEISELIKKGIIENFWDGSGWFISTTEIGKQHDVWGTLFAICLGMLEKHQLEISLSAILKGYLDKKCIDENGYVRHILVDEDYSRDTSWEKVSCPYQTYQNGGYWPIPTGWYIYSLSKINLKYARQLTDSFLDHVLKFRKEGAPFEWKNNKTNQKSGCFYGPSASLPYAYFTEIFSKIVDKR